MGKETKSESITPTDKIERAWRKLTASEEQYNTYKGMSSIAVEELMEEIRKGKPPKEGIEYIYGYLRAVEE